VPASLVLLYTTEGDNRFDAVQLALGTGLLGTAVSTQGSIDADLTELMRAGVAKPPPSWKMWGRPILADMYS
jgi:hypothetical protein